MKLFFTSLASSSRSDTYETASNLMRRDIRLFHHEERTIFAVHDLGVFLIVFKNTSGFKSSLSILDRRPILYTQASKCGDH